MSLEITHNEDIINEIVPVSRGDDGLLEGAAIGDDLASLDVDSSDSDEEEGIVIHAGRTTSNRRPLYKSYATKQFQRTQLNSGREFSTPSKEVKPLSKEEEELKKLRFSRHLTAFDVDINTLEEHPWRNKNVDLLDYFNYGFNEKTWQQYCEKQLRIRAQKGLGPHQPPVAKVPVVPLASLVPASANLNLSTATAPPPQPSIQPTSQQQPPPQLTMPQNNQQSTMPAAPPGGLPSGSRPSTGMPLPPSWQHMPPPPMPPHLQQTGFQHMPPIMAPPMHPAGNWQGRMPPQPWDVPMPSHQPFSQGGGDRQYEVHKEQAERSKDVTRDSTGKSRDVSDRNRTSSDQEKPSRHTADNRQERSRADSRDRGDSRNRDSEVKKASESGRRKDSRERESGGIKTESKGTTSSSGRDARRDSRDRERDREKKTLDRREDSSRGERRHESSSAGSRKSESSTKRHRDSRSRSRSKEHKRKR